MTDMQRWLESGQAPHDALALLRQAQPPGALDAVTRARSRHRLIVMTTVPAAASLMFWLKSVALGAVIGSAVTAAIVLPNWRAAPAVSTLPARPATKPAPAPPPQTPRRYCCGSGTRYPGSTKRCNSSHQRFHAEHDQSSALHHGHRYGRHRSRDSIAGTRAAIAECQPEPRASDTQATQGRIRQWHAGPRAAIPRSRGTGAPGPAR